MLPVRLYHTEYQKFSNKTVHTSNYKEDYTMQPSSPTLYTHPPNITILAYIHCSLLSMYLYKEKQ